MSTDTRMFADIHVQHWTQKSRAVSSAEKVSDQMAFSAKIAAGIYLGGNGEASESFTRDQRDLMSDLRQ